MAFVVSNDIKTLIKYECEDNPCDVIVPGIFTTIGDEAFYDAYNVSSVTIEDGVTKIGESAFCSCSMESITLPKTIEEIEYDAFAHCKMLKKIILPDNLKKLGKAPFACCSTDIIVNENNNILKVLDKTLFSKDGKKLIYHPTSCEAKTYTVPKGTEEICELAFAFNKHITEIVLPDGVKEIKGGAFGDCTSLQKVVIPASVTNIDIEFDAMYTFDAIFEYYYSAQSNFIIEAPKGSYAIEFAKEHNIKYNELN